MVQFTKRSAPVHFIAADDPHEAAAVREVDLQRKYHLSNAKLAEKLGLTRPRVSALRKGLAPSTATTAARTSSAFYSQRHLRFSDNALRRLQNGVEPLDMAEVWEKHEPRRRAAVA